MGATLILIGLFILKGIGEFLIWNCHIEDISMELASNKHIQSIQNNKTSSVYLIQKICGHILRCAFWVLSTISLVMWFLV